MKGLNRIYIDINASRVCTDLHPAMQPVLKFLAKRWPMEVHITSILGGRHLPYSWHYWGRAIDVSVKGVDKDKLDKLVVTMRRELGSQYDVIYDQDHIQIEFDPGCKTRGVL